MGLSTPKVLNKKEVARTRLFRIEEMNLRFSNGVERTYERLAGFNSGHSAVMVVPLLDDERFVMIEEYAAGTEDYQLSLPKGLVEPGEDLLDGANRELMEEAGYGARHLERLTELTLSPNYMTHRMQVVIARDLYEKRLQGDEPEMLGVHIFRFDQLSELVQRPDFTEARAMVALFMARDLLGQ
ncbi:ADP compounds hydrolase NudE [Aestuariirhabdus sp. Z084]|uniref:ADP compounds hydrolase NudE n=1 Tax=Aestuariirhabdus haliotis TaxID=2918751 RepID=UPI00201B3B09|nr:ADP compounds hydrolase NudE [Aestuariirhabdus haliotis]MCL6414392.1 ADP compounds hydrolase NudE [Aestuariirhabdus haliotis]MCL6418324.1 ADP compounds hydrolase NudE [Aestuariirhabdus haliotis]